MKTSVLRALAVMFVAACSAGEVTQPPRVLGTSAFAEIQDGANAGGNPDFFFLAPMVKSPAGNPLFLDNGFNPNLTPTVTIVRCTNPTCSTSESVLPATNAVLNVDHYQLNWQVPTSSSSTTYRVSVTVNAMPMGHADVYAAANSADLKTSPTDVVALKDGRTLPIKFVIENCALEEDACASRVINTSQGAVLETEDGGVRIPPQANGQTVRATVTTCPDIPTDLPKKSDCYRVTTEPALTAPLNPPAVVWVCSVSVGVPSPQEERYTMYRYDNPPGTTTALPHAPDECDTPPPSFSVGASVKGMLADLAHGRLRSAGRQLATLIGPRTLYATTMLDVGAGGETDGFSDFQLVLPGAMATCPDSPGTGLAGAAITAKVCVTDVGGAAVQGATVHFGAPVNTSAVTNAAGEASVSWTLALGPNTLTASGNGIGGSDNSGPRDFVDPFQPLSEKFDEGFEGNGPAVPVLTGSISISASGANSISAVNFGDDGYNSYGPFPISSTFSLPPGWPLPSTPLVSPNVGGSSPFGGNYGGCSITSGFGASSTFPVDTDILVTKTFSTPNAGTLTITVRIDNDVKVYLDGLDITGGPGTTGTTGYSATTTYNGVAGWWIHDGCADVGSPSFVRTSVPAGVHTLSIWAHDRGAVGFLDVKVVLTP